MMLYLLPFSGWLVEGALTAFGAAIAVAIRSVAVLPPPRFRRVPVVGSRTVAVMGVMGPYTDSQSDGG